MDTESRVKTGVPGLDDILHGGIPKNQLVLLSGTSGTGKTILSSQYIYNGVSKFNENGVFLSLEEPIESIKDNLRIFGWVFDEFEKDSRFAFIRYDPYRIEDVFDILESKIREIKAKRVVIDSISSLGLYVENRAELRKMIFNLSLILRRLNCTAILVSEILPGRGSGLSRYGVEEFVADSVIKLHYENIESTFLRAIHVWKLRGSSHSQNLHPYTITEKGIKIYHEDVAFIRT